MNFNDKPYEYLLERIKDLERELAAAQAQRDKAVFALADLYEQQTNEYICKCCGLRVEPHRCKTGEEF